MLLKLSLAQMGCLQQFRYAPQFSDDLLLVHLTLRSAGMKFPRYKICVR